MKTSLPKTQPKRVWAGTLDAVGDCVILNEVKALNLLKT